VFGKEVFNGEGQPEAAIQHEVILEVPDLWPGEGIHEEVRYLPDMFQEHGP
jgi:hypothetical protein